MHSKQQCMSMCSPWQHHLLLFCPALSRPMTDATESAETDLKQTGYSVQIVMSKVISITHSDLGDRLRHKDVSVLGQGHSTIVLGHTDEKT